MPVAGTSTMAVVGMVGFVSILFSLLQLVRVSIADTEQDRRLKAINFFIKNGYLKDYFRQWLL
jgi:hypothetical protein